MLAHSLTHEDIMKTHSEMIKADSPSAMAARIEAYRTNEHIELRINNKPVDALADEYPMGTILDIYREGGWYEASETYEYREHWIMKREFFGPYFDGRYDHETIYN